MCSFGEEKEVTWGRQLLKNILIAIKSIDSTSQKWLGYWTKAWGQPNQKPSAFRQRFFAVMVFMVLCLALITCCLQNSPTWKNWRLKEQELWPQVHPGSKQFVQPMCWFHPTEWFPYCAMTKGKWEQGCSVLCLFLLGAQKTIKAAGEWGLTAFRPGGLQIQKLGVKAVISHTFHSHERFKKKKKKITSE